MNALLNNHYDQVLKSVEQWPVAIVTYYDDLIIQNFSVSWSI